MLETYVNYLMTQPLEERLGLLHGTGSCALSVRYLEKESGNLGKAPVVQYLDSAKGLRNNS